MCSQGPCTCHRYEHQGRRNSKKLVLKKKKKEKEGRKSIWQVLKYLYETHTYYKLQIPGSLQYISQETLLVLGVVLHGYEERTYVQFLSRQTSQNSLLKLRRLNLEVLIQDLHSENRLKGLTLWLSGWKRSYQLKNHPSRNSLTGVAVSLPSRPATFLTITSLSAVCHGLVLSFQFRKPTTFKLKS